MRILLFFVFSLVILESQTKHMLQGTNMLFFRETEQVKTKSNYVQELKKLNLETIRYPGGEIADNYDWRTNTFNDMTLWPKINHSYYPIDTMDFNNFMQLQKKLAFQPLIVVNLENGFIENDIEAAAESAAEWVRYANIKMKYHIKYWEIGNESYLIQSRRPLTAKEYVKAFNLFAKKMKAVDPTIMVGANGPFGVAGVALYDKLNIAHRRQVLDELVLWKRVSLAKRLLHKQKDIKKTKWWHTVLTQGREEIDFIALHHYNSQVLSDRSKNKPLRIKGRILRLKDYSLKLTKKDLPIMITEWNISPKAKLSNKVYAFVIDRIKKEFESSGIMAAYFWPLRERGKRHFGTMLDISSQTDRNK